MSSPVALHVESGRQWRVEGRASLLEAAEVCLLASELFQSLLWGRKGH